MEIKLGDSELKVMDVLWKEGDATAKHISDVMTERYGWNINTTYTLRNDTVRLTPDRIRFDGDTILDDRGNIGIITL